MSEALTNTAKHARATAADVEVTAGEGVLHVRVHDDGRGGADFGHGSGLVGLKDRAEALGGRLSAAQPARGRAPPSKPSPPPAHHRRRRVTVHTRRFSR